MKSVHLILKTTPWVLFSGLCLCLGADWPQYRGPESNGISQETGLIHDFGSEGPRILWKRPIGDGFSAVSISNGALFTADADSEAEFVIKANPLTGEAIWRRRLADTFEDSWGNGPRSTPTVTDTSVYILSGNGTLVCLNRQDGETIWTVDFKKSFGVDPPRWGFSASPVVVGDRVIVEVGAPDNRSVAAFDKDTGRVLWTGGDGASAYGTPAVFRFQGKTQLAFLNNRGLISLDPNGEVLWQFDWKKGGIKPATPVFVPPDLLVASAAYGTGVVALRIKETPDSYSVQEVWQDARLLRNHFSSSLTLGALIYGFDNATLKCIDPKNGNQRWAHRGGLGKGSLIAADGMLIVLSETGTLKLIKATPDGFHELASAELFHGRCWTAPSLAHGLLYLRDREQMICLDMRPETHRYAPKTSQL